MKLYFSLLLSMEIKLYSKVSYFVMRKKEIERETQSNK